ncbi:MAG TPA: spermidine/putrescine ABC transporter substrate-binding protein [Egibacteraceae bacterium]|nr:spermidine/putrescine ABC transporter substrate-binding protein [Egibacteraceae bacterium]
MRTRLLAILALLALLVAACGGASPIEGDAEAPGNGGEDAAAGDDGEATEPAGAGCEEGETDGDIVLYNWTEYMDPELLEKFEEEYGVSVTEDFYPSNEELLARVQGGASGYDVIVPSDYMVSIMIEEGLLLRLDEAAVPNRENISEDFASPPYDPDLAYSMPFQYGTTGLGVNLDEMPDDFPRSWALVFDPEVADQFSGRISLLDDPRETMGAALKYLGYGLNETSDEALQEAADLVSEARNRVAAFTSDQYTDFLVGGETIIGHGFSGTFQFAFVETDNFESWEYFVPEEGGTIWTDNMAVLADSEHPCSSQTFINFILDADNGAQLSNWTYYESPNAAAQDQIDDEVTELADIPDDVAERLEFIEDTGDDEIKFTDYFNRAKG